jgi:hypothetical protein
VANNIPIPADGNPQGIRRALALLTARLNELSNQVFATVTLSNLTASRLVSSSASKVLVSANLVDWVTGGTGIGVVDDGDGTITINASGAGIDHSLLSNLDYASSGHTGFEPTVTKGNLTAGSTKITIGGTGTGAVIGTGVSVDVDQSQVDHNSLLNYAADRHFLQTDITNISTALSTGLVKVTTGTGLLSIITDNSTNWDTAYGWGDHAGLYTPIAHKTTEDALNGLVKVDGAGGYSAITDSSINWDAAYTHITNNGTDHSYIDQSVTTTSSPTFDIVYATSYMQIGTPPSMAAAIKITQSFPSNQTIYGVFDRVINTYPGNTSRTYAMYFDARLEPAGLTGNIAPHRLVSVWGQTQLTSAENETYDITLTVNYGFIASSAFTRGAGASGALTVTANYCFIAPNPTVSNGATITTCYAFYDNGQTSGVTNWGCGINTQSFFNANVRIGSNVVPTVALDVTGAGLFSSTLGVTGKSTLTGGIDVGSYGVIPVADNNTNLGSSTYGFRALYLSDANSTDVSTEGEIRYDSGEKALTSFLAGVKQDFVGCLFTQTATKTIENTTTESSFFTTGIGTLTLPANFFTVGKTVRIKLWGYVSGQVSHTATMKVKLGSVTLASSIATYGSDLTDSLWEGEYYITCRTTGATGTVMGEGRTLIAGGVGFVTLSMRPLIATTTSTIDTTASNTIDVTYTWGTADTDDSLKITHAVVEVLN